MGAESRGFPPTTSVFLRSSTVPICRCKGGRFISFREAFGLVHFSSSLCLLLKAVHVIGLVPICHCKGGRLMSLRRAFSLVPFFTSLLHIVFFRRLWMRYCYYLSMCPCKGGRFMSSTLRTSNVSTALLHLVFFFRLLIVIFLKALNVV